MGGNKTLVAYFSASGQTRRLAKAIAKVAGADLFEIVPEVPYTTADLDWNNPRSRSSIEMNDPASRPPIANRLANIEDYDIVYLGFPIWWYVAPRIVETFLGSYDFSGKVIVPFATSGSSGMGKTVPELEKSCTGEARWLSGRRMTAHESDAAVRSWMAGLGL